MKKSRSSQNERLQRVQAAYHLLIRGACYSEVVQALSVRYKVHERQAKRYVSDAQALMRHPDDLRGHIDLALAQLDYIYQQALNDGKLDTAIRAKETQMKLRKERSQYASPSADTGSGTVPNTLADVIRQLEND